MKQRNWTQSQTEAINAAGNVLVSAAAGSGKTATLTERIVRRIIDGADIRRMLIVTFTKAAAGELRARIEQALSAVVDENPASRHITAQLRALGDAHIGTIHSFCLTVLRRNYALTGLPQAFRVADESEISLIKHTVMNELLDGLYESSGGFSDGTDKPCADFITLADNFARAKDDAALADVFLGVYGRLTPYPRGIRLLSDSADDMLGFAGADFLSTPFGEALIRERLRRLEEYEGIFKAFADEMRGDDIFGVKYVPSADADIEFIGRFREALSSRDYGKCRAAAASFSPLKLGNVRKDAQTPFTEYFKAARSDFSDFVRGDAKLIWSCEPERIAAHFTETSALCRALYLLLDAFERDYSARKARAGLCDFTDLERLTLKLLTDKESGGAAAAREISERYDEIYIDEFQDTNRVQDAVFAAAAGVGTGKTPSPRFFVGDIKQSIYRFRGADPGVFADYRELYSNADASRGQVVFMSHNFRSDGVIIDFINEVSRRTFGAVRSGAPFTAEDELICGNGRDNDGEAELYLTSSVADDGTVNKAAEPELVASIITDLLENGRLDDGSPVKPSDIAVLVRSANAHGGEYRDAVNAAGIPCAAKVGRDFFTFPEILLAECLLKAADNLTRDVYTAGLLRSRIFGFTLGDLVALGQLSGDKPIWRAVKTAAGEGFDNAALGKKCRFAVEKMDCWRDAARSMPSDEFIRFVFEDSGMYRFSGGETERRRLDTLYEYARRFEASGFRGLHAFTEFIDSISDAPSPDADKAPVGEAVSVMSVHAAKGLEFPVVILANCAGAFNRQDLSSDLLFCPSMRGAGGETRAEAAMKLRVTGKASGGLAKRETLMRIGAASALAEEAVLEEMRILYVALTRAREKLIMTASVKDPRGLLDSVTERMKFRREPCEGEVMSASRFTDYLIPACVVSKNVKLTVCGQTEKSVYRYAAKDKGEFEQSTPEEIARGLKERFAYAYPHAAAASIPAKLTVSRLYPSVLDEGEAETTEYQKPKPPTVPLFMSADAAGGFTGAERGTATHVFMQFADFKRVSELMSAMNADDAAADELERLIKERFISPKLKKAVYLNEAARFFGGGLFRQMSNSTRLYREFRFNIAFPAEKFTADENLAAKLAERGETVLVQGVIDAFYISGGEGVLVDYKTDRLTAAERENDALAAAKLSERHGGQLVYYREAAKLIFGVPVGKTLIYATHSGKAYEIGGGGL